MSTGLLIQNLRAEVEGKNVIRDVSLEIKEGEVIGLTGENGSGKTTLAQALMGSESVVVTGGRVIFEGKDLLPMKIEERARMGLYVSWQNPITVFGVSVFNLAKALRQAQGKLVGSLVEFRTKLEELLEQVGLPKNYVGRGVNEGMSGGERKRLELMFMLLLKPKLVVLDEIDSGMDLAGREMTAKIVKELMQNKTSFLVISHYGEFLKQLEVSRTWQMKEGVTRQNG